MPPKNQSHRIDDLLASVTEEMLAGDGLAFQDTSLRVERIVLEMVRPDPAQSRQVLPETIRFAFHNRMLTPTQALRQLGQLVQVAARRDDPLAVYWNCCPMSRTTARMSRVESSHWEYNCYAIWSI